MTTAKAGVEDPAGIYEVVAMLYRAYDSRKQDDLERLFSPNASLRILREPVEEIVGRDDVIAWLTRNWPGAPPWMHLTGTLQLSPAANGVDGVSDYIFIVRRETGAIEIATAGRYMDHFIRHDGRWVIEDRTIAILGETPD